MNIMSTEKRGRPKSDDPMNTRITFAATSREDQFMRYAADLAGKPYSVFCREAVMNAAMEVYKSSKGKAE